MILRSYISDNNIFHIFYHILKYHHNKYKIVHLIDFDLKIQSSPQKWRLFVLRKIYDKAFFVKVDKNHIKKKNKKYYNGYECNCFLNLQFNKRIFNIYNKISPKKKGKYILLNQRNIDNRYLYDYSTKKKLEHFIYSKKLNVKLVCVNFGTLKPNEQYIICSRAKIFISAHGAGCTNLIFTPKETPLIEINFRKHWYCDPVCNDHFHKKINMNHKCNGKLTYRKHFHKADFHNLCKLINKKYYEIQAVNYEGGFNDRNPINKKRIYIDGNKLIELIKSLI